MNATMTDEVRDMLQFVFAVHVAEVYDDPFDVDKETVDGLVEAGQFLGVDIWNREQLDELSGRPTSDYEFDRLQKIANADG